MKKAFLFGFLGIVIFVSVFILKDFSDKKVTPDNKAVVSFPTVIPTKKLTPSPSPKVFLKEPGDFYLLPASSHSYQTWNNCGPATLSMTLSLFGIRKSQKEIGEYLRPYQNPQGKNDDKAVFPNEMISYLENQGLKGKFLVNGDKEKLQRFLVNGIPVIVKQLLKINDDPGHYRLLRGFSEKEKIFIIDDSYFGPNFKLSYQRFEELWRPFNYGYIVVYRSDKGKVVEEILGQEIDEKIMYKNALKGAEEELKNDPNNIYFLFNLGESYYHLENYQKAKELFERAKKIGLSRRMLWYHLEPIMVYNKLGEHNKVLEITEEIFQSGNPAFSEGYYERGVAYLGMGEKEKAEEEFKKVKFYNKNFKEWR